MGKLQVSPVGARFSHPVVDAVIARPTTPIVDGDRASFESTDTWETEHDSSVDDAASTMTGLTAISKLTRSPSPTVSEFAGQVNPKAILRASYQSDQGMTIDIIKARLDGTKKPSNLGKQRPQTYQPPQSPTYKPYRPSSEPVPTISKHETQSLAPTVDAPKSVDKEDARAATLAQLNGLDSPELPASPEHPARPGLFRHTLYVNYSVPFQVPFGESDTTTVVVDESAGATMVSINKGKQAADPQVQLAIDANRAAFHARHSARYQRVESGLDDTPVRPRAPTPDSASRPDKTWSATAGEVGRALGIEALAPELPTPSRRSAYPSIEKQARRKPVAAKPESRIPRVSKSLPPSPAPDSARRFTNGVVPTRMNDSGYPVLNRSTVSFTTEPHYERRSLLPEEAKTKKQQDKKLAKQQMKQESQTKQAKAEQVNMQLEKLML